MPVIRKPKDCGPAFGNKAVILLGRVNIAGRNRPGGRQTTDERHDDGDANSHPDDRH
jgi:hypothetical protein